MGAMLKFPMAVNCTILPEAMGSAAMGVTVMLCIWRVEGIIMEPPPQEAINRKVIAIKGTRRAAEYLRTNDVRADDLRIDTSKYCRRARDSAAALDDRSNQCYADPGVKETLRRRFLPDEEELRCERES
jgi:hypothetical protein